MLTYNINQLVLTHETFYISGLTNDEAFLYLIDIAETMDYEIKSIFGNVLMTLVDIKNTFCDEICNVVRVNVESKEMVFVNNSVTVYDKSSNFYDIHFIENDEIFIIDTETF